jgi:hypothetical protein
VSHSEQGDGHWEVATVGELQTRYGLYAEAHTRTTLNPERVPEPLRHLVALAEQWAEDDDIIRDDMVMRASEAARGELKRAVQDAADELDAWLAGPAASDPEPSLEYCAFTTMVMAAYSL